MVSVADSTGKLESGALDGNTIMGGRQAQCSRATDDITDPPIESLYCFAGYLNVLPLEVLIVHYAKRSRNRCDNINK